MYGDGGDGVEAWAWPRSRRATAKGVKMLFASRRYSALEGGGAPRSANAGEGSGAGPDDAGALLLSQSDRAGCRKPCVPLQALRLIHGEWICGFFSLVFV